MKAKTVAAATAATLALAILAGCEKTKIDTSDNTPPTVEIKVQGPDGQYAAASKATLSLESDSRLNLMCVVSDPEGTSSVSWTYSGTSNSCTVSGASYDGVFTIAGLPAPAALELKGDPSGQVFTTLPLLATIKSPLGCTVSGNPSQQGFPFGSQIAATCTGRNWSSDPLKSTAVKTLLIDLQ